MATLFVDVAKMTVYLASDKDYLLHPAVLDACFQLAVFPPFHANYDPNIYYLPAYISSVVLHTHPRKGYLPPIVFVHFKLRQWTPGTFLNNYDVHYQFLYQEQFCMILRLRMILGSSFARSKGLK